MICRIYAYIYIIHIFYSCFHPNWLLTDFVRFIHLGLNKSHIQYITNEYFNWTSQRFVHIFQPSVSNAAHWFTKCHALADCISKHEILFCSPSLSFTLSSSYSFSNYTSTCEWMHIPLPDVCMILLSHI